MTRIKSTSRKIKQEKKKDVSIKEDEKSITAPEGSSVSGPVWPGGEARGLLRGRFRVRTPIPRCSSGVGLRRLIETGWNKNVVVVCSSVKTLTE
jgi:hypothetical protein